MTKKANTSVSELPGSSLSPTSPDEREACMAWEIEMDRLILAPLRRWPIRSSISRLGAVILGGVLLASCGPDVNDVGMSAAASISGESEKDASRLPLLERLDHMVVNQHSTAHDSDLPGVSVASY
ncbi:hypothetical protein [Acidovorax soli]|uniref:hypothetical protein n=1 Tax=Acidovorax soli TaxID=592050 RepID=UPI001114EC82|nr:hypothetical protein [Acidovorax soli]